MTREGWPRERLPSCGVCTRRELVPTQFSTLTGDTWRHRRTRARRGSWWRLARGGVTVLRTGQCVPAGGSVCRRSSVGGSEQSRPVSLHSGCWSGRGVRCRFRRGHKKRVCEVGAALDGRPPDGRRAQRSAERGLGRGRAPSLSRRGASPGAAELPWARPCSLDVAAPCGRVAASGRDVSRRGGRFRGSAGSAAAPSPGCRRTPWSTSAASGCGWCPGRARCSDRRRTLARDPARRR